MSQPPRKVARPRAALVAAAAAAAQESSSTPPANNTSADPTPTVTPVPPTTPGNGAAGAVAASHPPATGSSSSSAASHAVPMVRAQTVSTNGDTGSARSTPALSDAPGGSTQAVPLARMKFKPKIPIRRVKKEVDVKPEISSAPAPSRGGARGRGRGGSTRGGRGAPVPSTSIAAGPFGAARLTPSSWGARRPNSSAPRFIEDQDIDQYSDNEDDVTPGETRARRVIDMAEVSALGESAPTSLVRDRRLNEKGKVKAESKVKKDKEKKRRARREAAGGQAMDVDEDDVVRVKPEPISPEKRAAQLPERSGGREDDAMVSDDEVQDRDERGRRLRVEGGEVQEEVNAAQMVDLSESEDEDYEEDMEGDFVPVDGIDNPQDKLYIFQFPHLFPRFEASGPVDMTQEDTKEGIKDVKPSLAALRGRKKAAPPPQGRIGTLVVMKSGKVKMVMGDNIVMNVNTGVPATFLQHLVHMDAPHKAAAVLGEVNKHFVVTPDVDRLLQELYISGGVTPGDKEAQDRTKALRDGVKLEPGLVKMED